MTEIELKFLVAPQTLCTVRDQLRARGAIDADAAPRDLRSVYFDTPDLALHAAGLSLRLRRDGARWIQTVKTRGALHGGLSRAGEYECDAPEGRLQIDLIADRGQRARIEKIVGAAAVGPVCETVIARLSAVIALAGGGSAEVSIDDGEIRAGDLAAPIHEVEIELIAGRTDQIFALAQDLFAQGGLRFSHLSKADRGHLLARDGVIERPPIPRAARAVSLTAAMTAEQAARDVLRECFAQIEANIEAVRAGDDPEGPHQLRVGLRRLRGAFSIFGAAIGGAEMERLGAEAKWLGAEVGALRNLDVAVIDLIDPEARAAEAEPGFAPLRAATIAQGDAARAGLRDTLDGQRVQAFLLHLARFAETRFWLTPEDFDQSARLVAPARSVVAAALAKRWARACARAKGIAGLGVEARHDLRKSLKQLRYAIEFAAPLFPAKQVAPFTERLKKLQSVCGRLNDSAMAEALFSGPDAPAADTPDAQRAAGRIIGARAALAAHDWRRARALWAQLKRADRFWT